METKQLIIYVIPIGIFGLIWTNIVFQGTNIVFVLNSIAVLLSSILAIIVTLKMREDECHI